MTASVFAKYVSKSYPHRYAGTLLVAEIHGGTPSDPKVAEGYLRKKLAPSSDLLLEQMVLETMAERNIPKAEALQVVNDLKHLNGFRRDERGLYIEGRQLKAALKEAVSVATNAGKITAKGWGSPDDGNYRKGIKAWFPEHVFVVEDRLHLGVTEPTGVIQKFVHTSRGDAIQYEEVVVDALIDFTIETDHLFTDAQWSAIWTTGERQGVGASRSQGYGTYEVTRWEKVSA